MSIFPFIENQVAEAESASGTVLKEYAWDFENNDFIYENGNPKIVEGLEALKIWAYKALRTERYKYLAYSWDYGQEIENLIGSNVSISFVESEAKRYIEEAFSVNPNIKGINNLSANIEDNKISINFTLISNYGEVVISV